MFDSFSPSLAFTVAFVAALCSGLVIQFWLASRQMRHVARHRDSVPTAFAATVPLAAHRKAADYTLAQQRLGLLESALSGAVLLGWTLLGGVQALNRWVSGWAPAGLWGQVALLVAFGLIGLAIDLPLSLYRTFGLEARFGFNKTSPRLWLADAAKGLLMGAALGIPLAALILWLMQAAGPWWWLWAWAAWAAFNGGLLLVYPAFIAPLFNRFEPLQDEALKSRVQALMARCGFAANGLFVMDGSRRSAHANAYFTGLGASKRVVFYDTLLSKLSPAQVDAVLAHELGHFKRRHVTQRIAMLLGLSLLGFALLGWLANQLWFYTGLGVQPRLLAANDALALVLFTLVAPVFTQFVSPLLSQLSRRHEFQADDYAVAQTNGRDLADALLKLYEDNAGTLTPDPLYTQWHASHPPASERIPRLLARPAEAGA